MEPLPTPRPVLYLLLGPTACGKSAIAHALARQRKAEILSVDSMKSYRQLEIGVAKPSPRERGEVVYHLLDWKDVWEGSSVAEWLGAAESCLASAQARGIPLIAEGGTSMYLKALREGLFAGPGRDPAVRTRLEEQARLEGTARLHDRLREVDPEAAARILPTDRRRIVRALEVFELSGQPISRQQGQWGRLRTDLEIRAVALGVEDRAWLYRRIDERVEAMLAAGWVEECRRLLALDRPLSREASQALGYRTLFAHLAGEVTLAQARERICFDTHHFARRQLSWFKKFPALHWVRSGPGMAPEDVGGAVARAFGWE